MGSFDYTCIVSGLPIAHNDPVRYFLLTQNPYCRGSNAGQYACYTNGRWVPRTVPVKAKYDSYGGVKDVQWNGRDAIWHRMFQLDLVQRDWGDNLVHDVPTKKTTPLPELLGAIHEGRLRVNGISVDPFDDGDRPKTKVPRGVPTVRRVERALVRLGLKLYGGHLEDAFAVRRIRDGRIEVRFGGYNSDAEIKALRKIESAFRDRWHVTIVGLEEVVRSRALLVGAYAHGSGGSYVPPRHYRRVLAVAHGMIREDVWRSMCKMRFGDKRSYEQHADSRFADAVKYFTEPKRDGWNPALDQILLRHNNGNNAVEALLREEVGCVGIYAEWVQTAKAFAEKRMESSFQKEWTYTVAQFARIEHALSWLRYQWHPTGSGPQFGEYHVHREYHEAMATIARKHEERQKKEREE